MHKKTKRHDPKPEVIAAALGFKVSTANSKLTPLDLAHIKLCEYTHGLGWLTTCIMFSCENAGLVDNGRLTKPKKKESIAEKELRVLATKAMNLREDLRASGRG